MKLKQINLTALFSGLLIFTQPALAASETEIQQQASQSVMSTIQALDQAQVKKSAQEWHLTEEEWQRYEQLKQGKRGILSPGLDPITTLGIEARTDEERRYFAELSVKQDFQRVEAELAFQREVTAAWKRVFPGILPIQSDRAVSLVRDGRLALFVKPDCKPCDARLASLLASQRPLDIYLVGSEGKDENVRAWALKNRIPTDKVTTRHITLNHDGGKWAQLGQGRMPVVLQQGENGWQIVTL